MFPKFKPGITAAFPGCFFKNMQQLFFPAFLWIIDYCIYKFHCCKTFDVSPYRTQAFASLAAANSMDMIGHYNPYMYYQALI